MFLLFFAEERMGKLKRHANPRQTLVRIIALGLVRIYYRKRVGISARRIRYVMVRNYKIQAVLFRPGNRLETPNPAVYAYHDLASGVFRLLKRRDVDTVAFGKSIGDVEVRFPAQDLQCLSQQDGPCRSVDVIVTPDQDPLVSVDRLEYSINRLPHAF